MLTSMDNVWLSTAVHFACTAPLLSSVQLWTRRTQNIRASRLLLASKTDWTRLVYTLAFRGGCP